MKRLRGGLLSVLGGAALLLALSPAISSATYPGANGRIAYSCQTQDSTPYVPPGICTILPDGSGMEQLTDDGHSPSWSASGRRLVFVRDSQIFTMDADGGNQTEITQGALNGNPQFSPNGRRIVFVKQVGVPQGSRYGKCAPDGGDPERIVRHAANGPIYLPNGRRIVFQGRPRGASEDGIWKVRPDGTHLRRLTAPGEDFYDVPIDISPDGEQILLRRCYTYERGCKPGTRVMRPDGSRQRPGPDQGGVFSPKGTRFAFVTGEVDSIYGDPYCLDIHTIRPTGTDEREAP